ncbi:hypothetical protein P167DRAFT_547340 [Morchella conica CCBAS932]|uniref:Uncharacterized protein n=1 Tax=Morchella conica CCBAS932 TaxID=1392247 RepID=A0A3N4KLI2_9PEZI|nr:hypothetical protein P167DRAFT_547340 [Morchella conica CCBAS932]
MVRINYLQPTLMWRWGSGCQLEAPNDLACLRLQILGKDHLLCDAAQGGQGGSSSRLLNKNEHGHEYLSDTTGREGRSGSRKRAALQQRAFSSNDLDKCYSRRIMSLTPRLPAALVRRKMRGSYGALMLRMLGLSLHRNNIATVDITVPVSSLRNFVKSRIPSIGTCACVN